MRTRLALLSAAFVAFVALNGPATALAASPELAPLELTSPVSLTESVLSLTDAVSANIEVMQTQVERLEEQARVQRILARRGRPLKAGWFAAQNRVTRVQAPVVVETVAAAAEETVASVELPVISESEVFYGNYAGPVNPLILRTILGFNGDISEGKARNLAGLIQTTADRYGVDPLLVTALVSQESAFYQSAVSPVGATGLGQLMPETAADLGVNPCDARDNLDGCVRYLADLQYYWSGSEDPTALALASYNAGAGNVEQYQGIPPFEETQNYVAVIKDRYATLSSGQVVNG